jgi:hypothetical protein
MWRRVEQSFSAPLETIHRGDVARERAGNAHRAAVLAGVRGAWGRCMNVASEVAADGQPDSATLAVYSELLSR